MRGFLQPTLVVAVILIGSYSIQAVVARPPRPAQRVALDEKAVLIRQTTVERRDVSRTLLGLGDLQPLRTTVIRAEVAAVVTSVLLPARGSWLPAGEVLVELDRAELLARLDEAQAEERAAESSHGRQQVAFDEARAERLIAAEQLELGQADLARSRELHAATLVADQQLEAAQLREAELRARQTEKLRQLRVAEQDLLVAAARIEVTRAARKSAALRLARTTLRAPYAGTVRERHVEVGGAVVPGDPIATLLDLERLKVVVPVAASRIADVQIGQPARILVRDLGRTFDGRVAEIVPQADRDSRTFEVVVEMENGAEPRVYPGHFARVEIQLEAVSQALVVPLAALTRRDAQEVVFRIDPDQRCWLQPVEVLETTAALALLAGGLAVGTQVAVESLDLLHDGALCADLDADAGATAPPAGS